MPDLDFLASTIPSEEAGNGARIVLSAAVDRTQAHGSFLGDGRYSVWFRASSNGISRYATGAALAQFQTVIHLVGRLTPADVARIDALTRDRLMATLRAARRR